MFIFVWGVGGHCGGIMKLKKNKYGPGISNRIEFMSLQCQCFVMSEVTDFAYCGFSVT